MSLAKRFRRFDVAPVFDAVLGSLIASGKHMECVDALIEILEPSLQALRETMIEKVASARAVFFPSYFDRKIAEANSERSPGLGLVGSYARERGTA